MPCAAGLRDIPPPPLPPLLVLLPTCHSRDLEVGLLGGGQQHCALPSWCGAHVGGAEQRAAAVTSTRHLQGLQTEAGDQVAWTCGLREERDPFRQRIHASSVEGAAYFRGSTCPPILSSNVRCAQPPAPHACSRDASSPTCAVLSCAVTRSPRSPRACSGDNMEGAIADFLSPTRLDSAIIPISSMLHAC